MKNGRVAVPSEGNGGIDGKRSGHFGQCDVFTIIDLKDGDIIDVSILSNKEHIGGGSLVPVQMLAGHKVNALIAADMGLRPLAGFHAAGIDVYFDETHPDVRSSITGLIRGNLIKMDKTAHTAVAFTDK